MQVDPPKIRRKAQKRIPIVDVSRRTSTARAVPEFGPQPRRDQHALRDLQRAALKAGHRVNGRPSNVLVLNYTMSCPLSCAHCCYDCGPRRTETMDLDFALSLVEQAAEIDVFKEIAFTGGEALVYLDDVLAIGRRAQEVGLPITVISSCYWASSDEAVREVLNALLDVGLARLTISHDPSHERWVPTEYAARAAQYASDRDCHVKLSGSFSDPSDRLIDHYPAFADIAAPLVSRATMPTPGRARKSGVAVRVETQLEPGTSDTCYSRIYHDLTVFWDGESYPCCSVYNRSNPGLGLGNLYDVPLAFVWDRLEASSFLAVIKLLGYTRLQEVIDEQHGTQGLNWPEARGSSGCDQCHAVLSIPALRAAISQWSAETSRLKVLELIATSTNVLGPGVARIFADG